MATNRDWLFSLPLEEQYAWMNAEHTESPTSETMQHIGQVIDDTVMRGVYGDTAAENADSRELILTDLEKKTREWHDYDGNFMRIYSDVAYAQIKELLDRQAAITERKCRKPNWDYCETCEALEKLTAERDTLQGALDIAVQNESKLEAERDELKERADYNSHGWAKANIGWAEANAESEKWRMKCNEYRNKFGKCLDYADAIHALMDDEGMA